VQTQPFVVSDCETELTAVSVVADGQVLGRKLRIPVHHIARLPVAEVLAPDSSGARSIIAIKIASNSNRMAIDANRIATVRLIQKSIHCVDRL
jgi:hypothetical protein